jgi:photosystem II stability/assembly factor-like uncharacterized protein
MKKAGIIIFIFTVSVVFSGCSITSVSSSQNSSGSFMVTEDGGVKWETKSEIDGSSKIVSTDILSMAVNSADPKIIYLGTENGGLFVSKDGGELWKRTDIPLKKIYAITCGNGNVYVSGALSQKGKIYQFSEGDDEWKEVYSEPVQKTLITAMSFSDGVIYSGTSEGMIFKSVDGGANWINLYQADGVIFDIRAKNDFVAALVLGKDVLVSKNGGETFESVGDDRDDKFEIGSPYSIDLSYGSEKKIYIGSDKGLFLVNGSDDEVSKLNTLNTKSSLPIRSVAVNPHDARHIIYSRGQGMYTTKDKGESWKIFDVNRANGASRVVFNRADSGVVYATFRNF